MGTTERKERDFGAPRLTKEVRFSFRCRPMFSRKYGEWLGDRATQGDISDALAPSVVVLCALTVRHATALFFFSFTPQVECIPSVRFDF